LLASCSKARPGAGVGRNGEVLRRSSHDRERGFGWSCGCCPIPESLNPLTSNDATPAKSCVRDVVVDRTIRRRCRADSRARHRVAESCPRQPHVTFTLARTRPSRMARTVTGDDVLFRLQGGESRTGGQRPRSCAHLHVARPTPRACRRPPR